MIATAAGRFAFLLGQVSGIFGIGWLVLTACSREPSEPGGEAAASASAVPGDLSPELASKVLAKVGERTITLGDYAAVLDRMDQFERLRYQSPERRRLLLDEIIRVELLASEARRRGLDRDPKTVERIRQVLRDEVLRRLRGKLPGPDDIPKGKVRAYYEKHGEEFREPERRRVAHIVLAGETRAAQVLKEALVATPTQWGKLVAKHSLDRSAKLSQAGPLELAGDLGIVSLGERERVPEELREAVFKIEKVGGVYGEVVKAGGKLHIVRLAGRTEARTRTFADAQRSIRVKLVQQRIREAERKLEAELRQRFAVRVDDEALARVSVPSLEKRGAGSSRQPKQ